MLLAQLNSDSSENTTERRSNYRYPVHADLEYITARNRGSIPGFGVIVDMSNSGVLFETVETLPCGEESELAIMWPTKLNNAVLNLHVKGITVRARDGYTA